MATRVTDLRNGAGDYRSLDDRMLVLDFQAGNPGAFVEIHRRYGPLARHVCGRLLQNRADADEAFQEAMIRVFQGLHRFNGRYALQPWIARIATNVSLDQIRARSRRPQVEDGAFEEADRRDPADGPEEAFEKLIERDRVLSVLSGLPASHRTALVLRELEGRSHREIADTLGITPSQAKALIHRAKGSFRRGWMRAVTERGGLAGVAILPLLWLLKAGDLARRLFERTGHATTQAIQVATPEVVTAAASSPAASTTATGMAERLVAASVSLLVAGGVTAGAITTLRQDRGDPPPERAAPAATPAPSPAVVIPADPSVDLRPHPTREAKKDRKKDDEQQPVSVVATVEDEGAGEPSPVPSATPTPSPTPTESPSPDPSPTPVAPGPPPGWSFSFQSDVSSVEECRGCGSSKPLVSRIDGEPLEGAFTISRVIWGSALDAEGDRAWRAHLEYWGSVNGTEGGLTLRFTLVGATGAYVYDGIAVLAERSPGEGEGVGYRFAGSYHLVKQPNEEAPPMPVRGEIGVWLSFWGDGTLYADRFALLET